MLIAMAETWERWNTHLSTEVVVEVLGCAGLLMSQSEHPSCACHKAAYAEPLLRASLWSSDCMVHGDSAAKDAVTPVNL